jgi:hypothetical protein
MSTLLIGNSNDGLISWVQVKLQDMYNKYYEEEPDARTIPIPTAFVSPGERHALQLLRYQKRHRDAHLDSSQVDDVMKRLWQGLRSVQEITARSNLPSDIFGALNLYFQLYLELASQTY